MLRSGNMRHNHTRNQSVRIRCGAGVELTKHVLSCTHERTPLSLAKQGSDSNGNKSVCHPLSGRMEKELHGNWRTPHGTCSKGSPVPESAEMQPRNRQVEEASPSPPLLLCSVSTPHAMCCLHACLKLSSECLAHDDDPCRPGEEMGSITDLQAVRSFTRPYIPQERGPCHALRATMKKYLPHLVPSNYFVEAPPPPPSPSTLTGPYQKNESCTIQ